MILKNKLWWCRAFDDNNSVCSCVPPVRASRCWLLVKSRIDLKVLLLTCKALHVQAPCYLTEPNVPYHLNGTLRPQNAGLLAVPGVAKCSLEVSAAVRPFLCQPDTSFMLQNTVKDFLFTRDGTSPAASGPWQTLALGDPAPWRFTDVLMTFFGILEFWGLQLCWWLEFYALLMTTVLLWCVHMTPTPCRPVPKRRNKISAFCCSSVLHCLLVPALFLTLFEVVAAATSEKPFMQIVFANMASTNTIWMSKWLNSNKSCGSPGGSMHIDDRWWPDDHHGSCAGQRALVLLKDPNCASCVFVMQLDSQASWVSSSFARLVWECLWKVQCILKCKLIIAAAKAFCFHVCFWEVSERQTITLQGFRAYTNPGRSCSSSQSVNVFQSARHKQTFRQDTVDECVTVWQHRRPTAGNTHFTLWVSVPETEI